MVSLRLIVVIALILPVGCAELLEDLLIFVSPPSACAPLGPVDIQELDVGDYTLKVLRFDGFPLHYSNLYPRRGFMNELGQFVFSGPESEVTDGMPCQVAFLFDGDSVEALPTIAGNFEISAHAFNDEGLILATARPRRRSLEQFLPGLPTHDGRVGIYTLENGHFSRIRSPDDALDGWPSVIVSRDVLVGSVSSTDRDPDVNRSVHLARWNRTADGWAFEDLGIFLPNARETTVDVADANEAGLIVGTYRNWSSGGVSDAFTWNAGERRLLPKNDWGSAGAAAVNGGGRVVGSVSGGNEHGASSPTAAVWIDDELIELPGLIENAVGRAVDINADGEIVGQNASRPVLWRDGTVIDLNELIGDAVDFTLETAIAINDAGQILAVGLSVEFDHSEFARRAPLVLMTPKR